jgi:hypothetical protein
MRKSVEAAAELEAHLLSRTNGRSSDMILVL